MKVFAMVAQSRSLSAAGRELGVSAATISRQIQSLEDELGAQLLNRSTRNISLTQAGSIFLERSRHILRQLDEARTDVSELENEPRGRLHVHSRGLVGRHLVLPAATEMRERHPNVQILLTLSDTPLDLAERNIDVSIRGSKDEGLALLVRKLSTCSRVLCANPAFVEKYGAPSLPEDLADLPCVTFQFDLSQPVWRLRTNNHTTVVRPLSVAQSNDGEALRLMALQGLGVALMPEWSVRRDIAAGRLVDLFPGYEASPSNSPFEYPVYAMYQATRHRSAKLRAFLDVLVGSIRRQARSGWV
jgi:DNA-binding transcriptional LysR family regulator